jgi:hypothetical protein
MLWKMKYKAFHVLNSLFSSDILKMKATHCWTLENHAQKLGNQIVFQIWKQAISAAGKLNLEPRFKKKNTYIQPRELIERVLELEHSINKTMQTLKTSIRSWEKFTQTRHYSQVLNSVYHTLG